MQNIRNSVSRREIIKYIRLRLLQLTTSNFDKDREEIEKKIWKVRLSELDKLFNIIHRDTIRAEIKKLHKHFEKQNKNKEKEK